MCPCGIESEKEINVYSFLKNLDLNNIIVVPDLDSKTIEICGEAKSGRVILHTCQKEDLEQVCAIRSLDPTSKLSIIPSKENKVLIYANYERWNYVLSCFAVRCVY
jgi:hypothetical protein